MAEPDPQSDQPRPISGILLIDKPEGPSSMHACARVRAALRRGGAPKRVKVGHGGTLDPLATGLLVILCGRATTLCDRIMIGEKRYFARVDLSAFTTTDDREGVRTEVEVEHIPTEEKIRAELRAFVGDVMQRPPAFSAMKVGGRRAYALARQGQNVELEPRPVTIHSVGLVSYVWPFADLDVRSGKGVYIRSLARDLGTALGTGGSLAALRRTAVGRFDVENAIRLDDLPDKLGQEHMRPAGGFGVGPG